MSISKEAAAAATDLTSLQIIELLNIIRLAKIVTPDLVTPELIQREGELSEILTSKLDPPLLTPEEELEEIKKHEAAAAALRNIYGDLIKF